MLKTEKKIAIHAVKASITWTHCKGVVWRVVARMGIQAMIVLQKVGTIASLAMMAIICKMVFAYLVHVREARQAMDAQWIVVCGVPVVMTMITSSEMVLMGSAYIVCAPMAMLAQVAPMMVAFIAPDALGLIFWLTIIASVVLAHMECQVLIALLMEGLIVRLAFPTFP